MRLILTFPSFARFQPMRPAIRILVLFFFFYISFHGFPVSAQLVIGGLTPDTSAQLEVRSQDKGMLIPRLSIYQRDAIHLPANGLMIFNTNLNCLEVNTGRPEEPVWSCLCDIGSSGANRKCGAFVKPGIWQAFMCRNLGAFELSADPFAPDWKTHGGYWQWGASGPPSSSWQVENGSRYAHGPRGKSAELANAGPINGWSPDREAGQEWQDTQKLGTDPCPEGFRVPTIEEWEGVMTNNTLAVTGSWSDDALNYGSGRFIGDHLMLPATGKRFSQNGQLQSRGIAGFYWSSSSQTPQLAQNLYFDATGWKVEPSEPTSGYAIRCIKQNSPDDIGRIESLLCGQTVTSGDLIFGKAADGFSLLIPYTGGNGGFYDDQMISSEGVTGLTASLTGGLFLDGNGTLELSVEGVPEAAGTGYFHLMVGGQTCVLEVTVKPGSIAALDCQPASELPDLVHGRYTGGDTVILNYQGGNGGAFLGGTVASQGVTGLELALFPGEFSQGDGSVQLFLVGTPSSPGLAVFPLELGGLVCQIQFGVESTSLEALLCDSALVQGEVVAGFSAGGVNIVVPYTGGNGGQYDTQTAESQNIEGLVAVLESGLLEVGDGTAIYKLTGVPPQPGVAIFDVELAGQACQLNVTVDTALALIDTCGAYVGSGEWRGFMCHNLGVADLGADPSEASWEIIGGYWQWGRKGPDNGEWTSTNTNVFAHGPTGSAGNQANDGAISGWNTTPASITAWSDQEKSSNDPCPPGYRIPTASDWEQVSLNNTIQRSGTWASSAVNYSSGIQIGSSLFLPVAGVRVNTGALISRGSNAFYWSSTNASTGQASGLYISESLIEVQAISSLFGSSVRCISELQ